MNHIDRISKHAQRAKAKLLIFCTGCLTLGALVVVAPKTGTSEPPFLSNNLPFKNSSGFHATFSTDGSIDLRNELFQDLGTNDRSCVTCHQPEEGWTITPAGVQNDLTGRKEPTRFFESMTDRTRRMRMSRR